ncbi:hypothetical protein VTK26DRAFT_7416 [Humicola hyalothermophila]
MDRYNKYLAESVLTEDKVVTYRLLSRALRVHVNTAKQMLYEFHRNQNAKRPGAVHATYLVYGTKKAAAGPSATQNGADDDVEMTSSASDVESLAESVPTFTLSLVSEEQLKEALEEYEEVSSIHVYSVGPNPTKDLVLLADVANDVLKVEISAGQKIPTTIVNPLVRRRERHGLGVKAAAASAAALTSHGKPALAKVTQACAPAKAEGESKPSEPNQDNAEKSASSAPAKKGAQPSKRGASSGIMEAFSRASAKPKTATKTSQPATPSGDDNSTMPALSDDGEDDEELPQPKPRQASGKSRKQREEELKRMMEEDDDDEEESSEKVETPQEEPMEDEPAAPEPAKEEEVEEKEVVTASGNGRRRGRRRVMRKKQIMDDEGYLVTIQEPGWESFSEDEAPPPPKAPKTTSSAPSSQAAKPKKGGQKGSQGSIMSFFSKK